MGIGLGLARSHHSGLDFVPVALGLGHAQIAEQQRPRERAPNLLGGIRAVACQLQLGNRVVDPPAGEKRGAQVDAGGSPSRLAQHRPPQCRQLLWRVG